MWPSVFDVSGVVFGVSLATVDWEMIVGGFFFFFFGIFVLLGGRAFPLSWRDKLLNAQEKHLGSSDTVEIASLKESAIGQAVKGVIRGTPSVQSPVSGTPCLWYSFQVKETIGDLEKICVLETEFSNQVYLEDKTGRCEVSLRHAEVSKRMNRATSSGVLQAVNDPEKRILEQYGISSTSDFLGLPKKLRFEETVLLPGETVVVTGRCTQIKDEGFGTTRFEAVPSSPEEKPVFISSADLSSGTGWGIRFMVALFFIGGGVLTYAAHVEAVSELWLIGYYFVSAGLIKFYDDALRG